MYSKKMLAYFLMTHLFEDVVTLHWTHTKPWKTKKATGTWTILGM